MAGIFQAAKNEKHTALMKLLNKLEEQYLIARNNKDQYLPFRESNYKIGVLAVTGGGYGFVDLPEGSFFISADNLFGALNGDEVLIKLNENDEGSVIKVLHHLRKTLVLVVEEYCGKNELFSINRHVNTIVEAINKKDFRLMAGHYVESEIVSYYPCLKVKIKRIIGHKNDPGNDITAILLDYQLSIEFTTAVMEEASKIAETVSLDDLRKRTDHSKLLSITIDGEDAKDMDDAVSLEKVKDKYKLYVHIADVAHYIKEGSELDKEAYHRSSSIYMVDRVVPMLPHSLSNGICSLNPNQLRLTITCLMTIGKSGVVEDYSVHPSFIKTTERMTYFNVNKILEDDDADLKKHYHHLGNLLENMKECSVLLRNRREQAGALDFEQDEARFIVDKKGGIADIGIRERGLGERIIEDFMIAANESVAKLMKHRNIPSVYRIHDDPPVERVKEFLQFIRNMNIGYRLGKEAVTAATLREILEHSKTTDLHQIVSSMLLRTMSKAVYSEKCKGHYGLALKEYLHFTAPIRRYADLTVHRNLRKYLFDQNYDKQGLLIDNLKAAEIADYVSIQERKIMAAEYEVEDMKKAEFMLKYQNQPVSGIITSMTKQGFYVQLKNTVEGFVRVANLYGYYEYDQYKHSWRDRTSNQKFILGQKVDCLVKYVDKEQRLIEFEVLHSAKTRKNRTQHPHWSEYRKGKSEKKRKGHG